MDRLAGRVAVVVGAGQTAGETVGNGRATAITFAREGARLVLVDREPSTLEDTAALVRAEGAEVVTVVADVAADDGPDRIVAGAVEAFGGIDVLHNNVGIGAGDGPPHHLADDAYDRIMDVNLRAMWRTCRAAVPLLRASDHGAIVNVSSLASIAAAGNLTAYKLSKAGVNALTQNLAVTNAKHGVRANAILPGWIETPMTEGAFGWDRFSDKVKPRIPFRRWGEPEDFGGIAVYLASAASKYHTGDTIIVDGGYSTF